MSGLDIALVLLGGAGLIHGLLTAVIITVSNSRSLANRVLALMLLFFAYRIGKSIALYFLDDLEFLFIFSGLGAMLAIGPLLLIYFKSLSQEIFQWKNKYFLHFFPALAVLILSLFVKKEWFQPEGQFWIPVMLLSFYAQFLGYILFAFKTYNGLKSRQRTLSIEKILKWMRAVLIGIVIIWVAYVLNIFEEIVPYILGPILYSIVIYVLTIYGIKLEILKLVDRPISSEQDLADSLKEYSQIVGIVEQNRSYLNADISLTSLAKETKTSPPQLSKLINEHAKKNFNDFINSYRVEAAKSLLMNKENDHLNISAIAIDCGFNSLSSFNSAFKKVVGKTPSTFRQNTA